MESKKGSTLTDMRITAKGQVTIPIAVREQLGLREGDEVDFVVDGAEARMRRAEGVPRRGAQLAQQLRGRLRGGMSTDEIMALTRER